MANTLKVIIIDDNRSNKNEPPQLAGDLSGHLIEIEPVLIIITIKK